MRAAPPRLTGHEPQRSDAPGGEVNAILLTEGEPFGHLLRLIDTIAHGFEDLAPEP